VRARVSKASVLLLVFTWPVLSLGQGTIHITFDGPPLQPPGSIFGVAQYFEQGLQFRPIPGTDQFGRAWTNLPSAWPNNGTPYVITGVGDSLMFSSSSGPMFGLVSVDLAAFSTGFPNYTVNFVGYRSGGGTITTSFSGNGIAFQTYYFGPEWLSGLTRVEIPNYGWSLDNLMVFIPEPSAGAILLFGALMFGLRQQFQKSERRKKIC
jgi:hypothetical protein